MIENSMCGNASIEHIIQIYGDMIYKLAFAKTGNMHDADDVFQEVFLRYLKKSPAFNDEEHRKAWLIRVTVNYCNSFFNSWWKRNTTQIDLDFTNETQDDKGLIEEIRKLPQKYREVIHLFYYEDMSIREISKILDRQESTVRTQLTRARNIVKELIKEEDYV